MFVRIVSIIAFRHFTLTYAPSGDKKKNLKIGLEMPSSRSTTSTSGRSRTRSPGSGGSAQVSPTPSIDDPRVVQRQWELDQVRSFGVDALATLSTQVGSQLAPRQTLGVQLGHHALSSGSISSMEASPTHRARRAAASCATLSGTHFSRMSHTPVPHI